MARGETSNVDGRSYLARAWFRDRLRSSQLDLDQAAMRHSGRLVETKHPAADLKMPAGRSRKRAHSSAFPPFARDELARDRDELAKCNRAKCSPPQYPARKSEQIRVSSTAAPAWCAGPRGLPQSWWNGRQLRIVCTRCGLSLHPSLPRINVRTQYKIIATCT